MFAWHQQHINTLAHGLVRVDVDDTPIKARGDFSYRPSVWIVIARMEKKQMKCCCADTCTTKSNQSACSIWKENDVHTARDGQQVVQ